MITYASYAVIHLATGTVARWHPDYNPEWLGVRWIMSTNPWVEKIEKPRKRK